MASDAQVPVRVFFATRPVFTAAEFVIGTGATDRPQRASAKLKYYLRLGRLLSVARGLYAVVPPEADVATFVPDRFLIAATARSDACFCYHAALELLGLAHSAWTTCTVFTARRHPTIEFRGQRVRFLADPTALQPKPSPAQWVGINEPRSVDPPASLEPSFRTLATKSVDRGPLRLSVTGRERTLIEGLREPDHVGGLHELLDSFAGVKRLNLDVLEKLLGFYGEAMLWSAVGWYLEGNQQRLGLSDNAINSFEARAGQPKQPVYLDRRLPNGVLHPRWNLIVPEQLERAWEGAR